MSPSPAPLAPPAAAAAAPAAAGRTLSGAWAEIDLAAVRANLQALRAHVGPRVQVLPVVKTEAYGHGLLAVARELSLAGCPAVAVGRTEEALVLREHGFEGGILLLGPPPLHGFCDLLRLRVTPTISSVEQAAALSREAIARGREAAAHVKVDTGMGRLGVSWREAAAAFRDVARLPALRIEGLYTHFSCTERGRHPFTMKQIARFRRALRQAREAGLDPGLVHAANSGGLLHHPEAWFGAVRPGLLLFGLPPHRRAAAPFSLRPALALKARVAFVKHVPRGSNLSYGATFRTARDSVVGVLPLGYADGYPRRLSNRGAVLVSGRRCPVVGRVCMDQILVDLTDVPAPRVGDEAVLIGRQGEEEIGALDIADALDLTPHEVTTLLAPRVPRIHRGGSAP